MQYLVVILGLVVALGALAGIKGAQVAELLQWADHRQQKDGLTPESVGTARATTQNWGDSLNAVGNVTSVRGVAVSNEVPGVVARLHFDSGARVQQGQVLVELDASVERAQLSSMRARLRLARHSLQRSRILAPQGAIPDSQLDADESSASAVSADVQALQAQIERKSVRAPFSGRLGIRAINLGQYLAPGTTLAVLESTDSVFVDFSLPQPESARVQLGMNVLAQLEPPGSTPLRGSVSAIDPTLDPETHNIRIRASLPDPDDRLRPGMFVRVSVLLPQNRPMVVVPLSAVSHASYGDSLFVLDTGHEDTAVSIGPEMSATRVARQRFVRLGPARGDFVAVLEGVNDGDEVVAAGTFKLRNGVRVLVNNDVGPEAQLDPHPENR
jgi:membrane fusion protein (multidrug efflux system)